MAFSKNPSSAIRRDSEGRLLGGWELSGMYSLNSGLPLTVAASGALQINYNLPGGVSSVFNNATNGGTMTDNAGLAFWATTNAGLRPEPDWKSQ